MLIILAVVLVGLAIYVAPTMFSANATENSRNAMILDLQNFSARALAYYSKPLTRGGGGQSFVGITIGQIYPMAENPNGRYYVESATDTECDIVGVGKIVSGTDSIRVRARVTLQRNFIEILN